MGKYQLTNRAEVEIDLIFEHSILNFGLRTAQDYLTGMHECFDLLADNPSWGNDYGFIETGLQRYEYRSHSSYYRERPTDVLIVRILGNKQDPARHF